MVASGLALTSVSGLLTARPPSYLQDLKRISEDGTGRLLNATVTDFDARTQTITIEADGITYPSVSSTYLAINSKWKVLRFYRGNVTYKELERPARCGTTINKQLEDIGEYGNCIAG